MARRNDHSKEDLKNLILNAAKKIVQEEGLTKLTARRLAQDVGYTAGTLYHLFGSMDGVIFAINEQTLSQLSTILTNPAQYPQNANLTEHLKTMAELYMKFASENRQLWLMVFNHALPQGEKSPDWYRQQIASLFAPLEKMLSPLFSNKTREENILAARVLWLSVHGICYMEETDKTPLICENHANMMANYLIDTFVAGLSADI